MADMEHKLVGPCTKCRHLPDLLKQLGQAATASTESAASPLAAPLDILSEALPSVTRQVQAGQAIALEGDANGHVYGVLSGLVRCFRVTADGRRHIGRFAGPGSFIGLGMLGALRHSAEAVERSQLLVFRTASVENALETNSAVRAAVLRSMAEELIERERAEMRLARMSSDQRVADFLLEMCRDEEPICLITMTRADIGDHLGVTLETVSRALHHLVSHGLIELLDARHVAITNRRGLQDFVECDNHCFG